MAVTQDAGGSEGPVWALGLMSGTSLDGVDAALLLTDGTRVARFGPGTFLPYAAADTEAIVPVMADPFAFAEPARAEDLALAERDVTRLHARAVADLLATVAMEGAPDLSEAVIGFPGQTVAHAPERQMTWQIGSGPALARALGRTVVWDFRSADVAAGGQGAPLAPFYHHALALSAGLTEPVAFLNIGGVANVTWVDPSVPDPAASGALAAFDTGPGNALINDWMAARTGWAVDLDGQAAAAGLAEGPRAAPFETNFVGDYLARPGPKSLDRNAFNALPERLAGWSTEAGAAALTLFTVDCVVASLQHLPRPPARWLVCGGGRHNPVMMEALAERLAAPVEPVETLGLDGDLLEAQAFAYLAVRVLRGLPLSQPASTGVPQPVTGGRVAG